MDRREFISATSKTAVLAAFASAQQLFAESMENHPTGTIPNLKYRLDPKITYLNHGSMGTMPEVLHTAHVKYLEICETNPWLYMWAKPWYVLREEVRQKCATFLNCSTDELAFTHNTTEGFAILAIGARLQAGDEILYSTMNHTGASAAWEFHADRFGYTTRRFTFPIEDAPTLSEDDIVSLYEQQIGPKTNVLCFPHIDNMIGIRYPLKKMADMAHRKGVKIVAVDGAQAVGMIPVDLAESGVDMYSTSAHKWLEAPKATGLLYVKKSAQAMIDPIRISWGQSNWKDSARKYEDYGTRNLPDVMTLGDAIDLQEKITMDAAVASRQKLWTYAKGVVDANPKLKWRSPNRWENGCSLYGIEVVGKKSSDLLNRLRKDHGMIFRAFVTDKLNTCRLSLNLHNTTDEIDRFIKQALAV